MQILTNKIIEICFSATLTIKWTNLFINELSNLARLKPLRSKKGFGVSGPDTIPHFGNNLIFSTIVAGYGYQQAVENFRIKIFAIYSGELWGIV